MRKLPGPKVKPSQIRLRLLTLAAAVVIGGCLFADLGIFGKALFGAPNTTTPTGGADASGNASSPTSIGPAISTDHSAPSPVASAKPSPKAKAPTAAKSGADGAGSSTMPSLYQVLTIAACVLAFLSLLTSGYLLVTVMKRKGGQGSSLQPPVANPVLSAFHPLAPSTEQRQLDLSENAAGRDKGTGHGAGIEPSVLAGMLSELLRSEFYSGERSENRTVENNREPKRQSQTRGSNGFEERRAALDGLEVQGSAPNQEQCRSRAVTAGSLAGFY